MLWEIYSQFYDNLTKLIPYNRLLDEVYEKLDLKENDVCLDAGCGTGNVSKRIYNDKIKITAIDNCDPMLKIAKKKLAFSNVEFEKVDLELKLDFKNDTFDKVVAINVLYAVENIQLVVDELSRVLKKGGRLIFTLPLPSFKFTVPFFEHCRISKKRFSNFILALDFLVIGVINIVIKIRVRNRKYHFLDIDETKKLCGKLRLVETKELYSVQYMLFVFEKD